MYAKLFRSNIKKALKDYVIYFFTLVISSTLFFAFLSLTSRYNDILGGNGNYSLALFQNTIRYAVLAISIIFVALIRYINNYMLKQRSREFSVYMILGMEQRTVARHFFGETFVFGMAAVLTGCIVGTILSGMMTTFVMRTITSAASFRLGFYPDTILATLLFFGAVFVLVGMWNVRRIYKIKLIDLMNEKKTNEGQKKKKRHYAVSLVIAIICFAITGVVLYNFTNVNGIYAGSIPDEISNRYQAIAIVAAIMGIFSLYNAVAFLITVVRRKRKWKNLNINSVLLGNLFQKVSSTSKILSISTLAITISLVAFVILPMLAEITTGYLEYRMPYDVMIYNTYMYIDEIDDIPQIDFSFAGEILQKHGITVSEDVSQRSYFVWERDFNTVDTREYWRDLPRLAMSISDYNDMRRMARMEPVQLAENEFFMHLDYEMDEESVAYSIGIGQRTIQLDDGTLLNLAETAIYNDPLGKYLFNSGDSILVFPDSVCENLHLARTCYYANTETVIPYNLCDTIRDEESNDVALTTTSVRLLGIYSGIIFFIICMTVLALHLTTDSIDHHAQYRILYQMGTDRDDIVKMVSKQSLCYFFTPCLVAFMIALLVIYSFIVRYGHKVFTYMSSIGFQFGVLIPSLLVVLILACYYGATIYTIKRALANTLNSIA